VHFELLRVFIPPFGTFIAPFGVIIAAFGTHPKRRNNRPKARKNRPAGRKIRRPEPPAAAWAELAVRMSLRRIRWL